MTRDSQQNEERDYRTAVLARNSSAENAVTRDPIAATSVVEHGQGLVVGASVIVIVQGDALDAIGVMNSRGYEHVLVLRGQRGSVGDLIKGGPGISHPAAIRRARRAEIGRHGQSSGGLEPVAIKPEGDFGPAVQPAGLESDGARLVQPQAVGTQSHLAGVGPRP